MRGSQWGEAHIPDLSGRVAVITGANCGLGFATAMALARKNARVVLACRDLGRGIAAAQAISAQTGNAEVDTIQVVLDRLDTVRASAAELARRESRIDLLINNAGVMLPNLATTAEGVEMNMGVNHLGHFVWTGMLLPRLLETPGSRVVSLGSLGHLFAKDIPESLLWSPQWRYNMTGAYSRSKLAVMLFAQALQRRLSRAGAQTISNAAHPGGAQSELIRSPFRGVPKSIARRLLQPQSADAGALPTLRAACDESVTGGEYFGPDGWFHYRGNPVRVKASRAVGDEGLQERLWMASEAITGLCYPL